MVTLEKALEKAIGCVLIIAAIIIFFSIVGILINASTLEKIGYREVSCYDKFGNEIGELTCEEEVSCGIIDKMFKEEICYDKSIYLNSKYGENKK